jgi:flagellar hook capping protein FlgD
MSLPAPFRVRARRTPCVAAVLALLSAGAAHANYDWPVDGAPVCNAPGDQHRLFYSDVGCDALAFNWLSSGTTVDSVRFSGVGPVPPTGECSSWSTSAEAIGPTELSAVAVRNAIIAVAQPSVPWCLGPGPSAQLWLEGAGVTSQIVAFNPMWFSGPGSPFQERVIADDGDFVRHHPRMAPSGNAYPDTAMVVVWSDERTGSPQIRAQRVTWRGEREWGPSGVLIAATGLPQTDPEIARLQDGSSLIVWLDARSGGSDVYALRLLADGSLAPGWPSDGLALEAREETAGSPRIVGAGAFIPPAFVVWEESGPRFGGGRSIVALRLLDDGSPDPAWNALGVPLSSSPTVERLQDARLSGFFSPSLVAIWTDTRAATVSNPTDLYGQWLDASGSPKSGWPVSGLALCAAAGRQDAARVSATDTYAAFAWEDHRGANADVYAELRYADGTLPPGLWAPDGLPATSAPGDQTAPVVGVGNGGGCFIAWEDARDLGTTGLDIYAQAFTNEGEKLDVRDAPPRNLSLGPPRPNPMRASGVLSLQLSRSGAVRVDVLDVAGRRVRTLVAGDFPAGSREIVFDGLDDAGHVLRPGIYRVRALTAEGSSSRTVVRIQ